MVFVATIAMLSIVGCKSVTWTQLSEKIITEYKLTPEKLARLQYSNGSDNSIELKRVYLEKGDTIKSGTLEANKTEITYSIKIKPGTLGKCIDYNQKKFQIAFDSDSTSLVFAPDSKGLYVLVLNKKNETLFGSDTYTVIEGVGTPLCINLKQVLSQGEKKTTLRDLKVE